MQSVLSIPGVRLSARVFSALGSAQSTMFANRTEAGRQLAAALVERGVEADLVLGVPRGGLPVAREVADHLDVPLDVVAAKKMGAPGNPELAIGAVASDGSDWLNDDLVTRIGVDDDYLAAERERAAETAREKEETYRKGRPFPDVEGKTVLVVDDGLATGATATACVRRLKHTDAGRVVLAVPVGAPDSIDDLREEADEVVAVEEPAYFGAVGRHYRDFAQVTDEEARACLEGRMPGDAA